MPSIRSTTPTRLRDVGINGTTYDAVEANLAAEGFIMLDEGHFAGVYASEKYPGLVVRFGNTVDGFASYALLSRSHLRSMVGLHVPVIHDIAVSEDDALVALCERLDLLPEDAENPVISAANKTLRSGHISENDPDTAALDEAQPRFKDFTRLLRLLTGRRSFDCREGNLLLRGGGLIVNDPMGRVLLASDVIDLRNQLPLAALGTVRDPLPNNWLEAIPRGPRT